MKFTPNRRSPSALLVAGLLLLSACGQPAPVTVTPPVGQTPAAPKASLGVYELVVNGLGTPQATATVNRAGMQPQANEIAGLSFTPYSMVNLVDGPNRVIHMTASFTVTNNSGTAITVPTYVPIDTSETLGETPFKDVKTRTGAATTPAGMQVEPSHYQTGATIAADPNATPLVSNLDTGPVVLGSGSAAAGISHQGWQSTALAPGASQVVNFAVSVPLKSEFISDTDPFQFVLAFTVVDNPGTVKNLVNIAQVQGSTPDGDAASPLSGKPATVEGIVTAAYTANVSGSAKGFYLQEEGIDADADPTTSNGIFIYCNTSCPAAAPGDRVRVTGTVSEYFNATQITASAGQVTTLASGVELPAAVTLTLPLDYNLRERYEGMRVTASGIVTNNYPLGRGASFDIADARLPQFAQVNTPDAAGNAAYLASLKNRFIRIDDGSRAQNPDPEIFARDGQVLSAANTLRAGDTVTATGVLGFANDGWSNAGSIDTYRIHAAQTSVQVQATNPRTATPDPVGGTLRVGSMNVLNYFTTLVSSNTGCTPNGTDSANARGANNCEEFLRQQTKIVKAIAGLNPDVLGLLEIQNDFDKGANSSVANLVNALNTELGAGTYAYVNPGAKVGGDAISVAMIYKPAAVDTVGNLAVLDNTFDPNYVDTCSRPTWAQTFQSKANGGRFTAVMMHLKSKSSSCAALNDTDTGDGQGNAYKAREQAASVIVNWLATNPTGVEENDRLLMGDYNAYEMEKPLTILANGGYQNLFMPDVYSYQFDGQWGSLDHATASASLASQVTGKTKWHINSDEPTVLDYNTEFKSAGQLGSFYAPDPFRSSDHDPVLVGLNLTAQTPITGPVQPPATTLSANPAGLNVVSGEASATSTLIASTRNYTGTDLGISTSAPAGLSVTPSATTVSPNGTFSVTVSAPVGTPAGAYPVTVTTTGDAGLTASTTLTVNVTTSPPPATAAQPWINEINYDTSATNDAGEFVEVIVPVGVDVSKMSLVLYNGNGGASYRTDAFNGAVVTKTDLANGYSAYVFNYPATSNGILQNGEPDGLAICNGSTLVQFLSYEGTFTATNGCAAGVISKDIGVAQTNSSAPDSSLQLKGAGNKYDDFTWASPATNTKGAANTGQSLN